MSPENKPSQAQIPGLPPAKVEQNSTVALEYSDIQQTMGTEAITARQEVLQQQIDTDPDLSRINDLYHRSIAINAELNMLYETNRNDEARELNKAFTKIDEQLRNTVEPRYNEFLQLNHRRRSLDSGRVYMDSDDSEVPAFLKSSVAEQSYAPDAPVKPGKPHFVSVVLDYLKAQPYITLKERWAMQRYEVPGMLMVTANAEPFRVPAEEVLAASSFENWAGRGVDGQEEKTQEISGKKKTSLETIVEYAARPTDPIVEHMTCFMQPDGKRFYLTANDHRTAAYKARGARFIPVKQVEVKLLSENVI